MSKLHTWIRRFYDRVILAHPAIVIVCLLAVVSFLGYKVKDFKLDASTDTLIIETDQDLRYSRMISARYGGYDYLLVTYSPRADLFSDESLSNLTRLRDELKQLDTVLSVTSILDAPLLESPPVPVKELVSHIQTLESPTVDRKLARIEFKDSPLYRNLLVSPDLKTTGLQVKFKADEDYQELLARRDGLREKQAARSLTAAEIAESKNVKDQIQNYREKRREVRHREIAAIRKIIGKYRNDAQLYLGGISIITDDMINFIKNDLQTFGFGVAFFLIVTLGVIFRRKRWVFLPMLCCVFSAISMMGLLGLFGWKVTVISSNFISLQLIITMAVTIHLIVRYRELVRKHPEKDQRQLILETVSLMLTPCLYAALTTIAGFGSLLLCNILPVRSFGWMMSAGIAVSLVVTFLFFPAALMLMHKLPPHVKKEKHLSLTAILARLTETHGTAILAVSAVLFILGAIGISRLVVENSFINYFKKTTEIYQGMKVIDQQLGGTTPLDIIIDVVEPQSPAAEAATEPPTASDDEFEQFDEFNKGNNEEKYWFTAQKMALVTRIQDYLESLPETGKVMSLGTMLKVAEKLNNGKPLDNFQLALVYSELPEKFKDIILKPYVSPKYNQLRYSIRIKDSEKSLRRNALLTKIRNDLVNKLGLDKKQIHLTGLLVLYNNMLQSLFKSQILTLGVVVLLLFAMFLILFRSLKIALIALAPNMLAICVVLGFIGWLNIPLDMMTITIAAISIGMAVDNTIHYIYRFRYEFKNAGKYHEVVRRCHSSIGRALYYTSMTIIIGFSILALSNFIPSIYFGLLTGLALSIALIAALTLLPQLIIISKPFGPDNTAANRD
ncbi:MAG: MMPL family transporter [Desulfobacterales bacterium]